MWADGQYHDAFARNLPALRLRAEPAGAARAGDLLARFVRATFHDVDPVGGAPRRISAIAPASAACRSATSALLQEAGSPCSARPREPRATCGALLDLLSARGVRVAVVFPPLLNRDVLYLGRGPDERTPYRAIVDELNHRRIPHDRAGFGAAARPGRIHQSPGT